MESEPGSRQRRCREFGQLVVNNVVGETVVHMMDRLEFYGSLYQEEAPRLWRLLIGVAEGRKEVVEDAIVEAFTRAIERDDTIKDPAAWIYRTALNVVRDQQRAEARDPGSVDQAGEAVDLETGVDLLHALRLLPFGQRAAVILYYGEDMPIREVASRMGTAEATTRVHLFRARRALRTLLQSKEGIDAYHA